MVCEKKPFGLTKNGEQVTAYELKNAGGMTAVILDYGCIIQSLCAPDKDGKPVDVVLGYDTVTEYEEHDAYLGAAIGRVGNRIAKGEFTVGGKAYKVAINNGPNHLHGGLVGFDSCVWQAKVKDDALVLSRVSPDGEEGYPGTVNVCVTYRLTDDNALRIAYDATTDADTLVNLTNHSYFNLNGGGTVLEHELMVDADRFCENDPDCLPTGTLLSVEGTPFDFRTAKAIGRDIGMDDVQLKNGSGYDHNFCLGGEGMRRVAELYSAQTGIVMTTETTLPGVQVYSANFLTERKGKGGSAMDIRHAICLETQGYPDAVNKPHFPPVVLKAGETYHEETVYSFATK